MTTAGDRRRPASLLVPLVPIGAGAAWWLLGHRRGAILVVLGLAALGLTLAGVPVDRHVRSAAVRVASAVSVVLTGIVGLVLVGSGAAAHMVGIDPLVRRRDRSNQWRPSVSPQVASELADRPFGIESVRGVIPRRDSRRWGLVRGIAELVGFAALALAAVLGVRALVTSDVPEEQVVVDRMNFSGDTTTVADPRAASPAMASSTWADAYFREMQLTPSTYWPYTEFRPLDFEGKYINIDGWSRRTYASSKVDADEEQVVWVFGGSTAWGEGQRDDYTIPSHLVRIAEREGIQLRVRNFGQRGWTHFQEMVLFEQLLASEPAPDIAVFYDGANEITSQSLSVKGVPTHVLVDAFAAKIYGGAAGKSLDELGTDTYATSPQDASRAVDVYERGRFLSSALAEAHDVRTLFVWQPVRQSVAELEAIRLLSAPTVDLSGALDDHQDVYIDGAHTNEEGARLVAERLWERLEPVLAAAGRSDRDGSSAPVTAAPLDADPAQVGDAPPTLADLERILDSAPSDPCSLVDLSVAFSGLSVEQGAPAARAGTLLARALVVVADAIPEEPEAATVLREAAASAPAQAASTDIDPSRPFVALLPIAADPGAELPGAFSTVIKSLYTRCPR